MLIRSRVIASLLVLIAGSVMADEQKQKLQVLVSVKPLQLMTRSLLGELATVDLLVPVNASLHHYVLKPSDIRQLNKADMVLWFGEDLERFLKKPLARLPTTALSLLGDNTEEPSNADNKHLKKNHQANRLHGRDPHLWMSPARVLQAAEKIIAEFEQRYPDKKAALAAALTNFKHRLEQTDQQISARLSVIKNSGFYVFHDAYAGFTNHYKLNQLGYFTVDPARKPGVRRLNNIRHALEAKKARCVFVEPQFPTSLVHNIIGDLSVNIATLDPLGSQIAVDDDGYFHFLESLADQFSHCLQIDNKQP